MNTATVSAAAQEPRPQLSLINRQAEIDKTIELIKARNIEGLKARIPEQPHIIAESDKEYTQYIQEISLTDLFRVNKGEPFQCPLPEHQGSKPSANIFVSDEGIQLFKCFGCNKVYTSNRLIEKILGKGFNIQQKAKDLLASIFNIELVKSEYQLAIESIYRNNIEAIHSGELKRLCPTAYKYISNDVPALIALNSLASYYADSENITEDGLPIFYTSTRKLCEQLQGYAIENEVKTYVHPHTVNKKVQNLNINGFVRKLDKSELPSEYRSQIINYKARSEDYKRHTNCFTIPEYNVSNLEQMEQRAQELKAAHYTKTGTGHEFILRTFGDEEANAYFPQEGNWYSAKSQELTERIEAIIQAAIASQGYCTEQEIVDSLLGNEGLYEDLIRKQIKRSISQLLNDNGWQRIRCNKEVKAKYQVNTAGYPFIIVKV